MTRPLTPEEDALAGELALGVLDGNARAKALRLALSDPDFAAGVASWQQRLEPLTAAFDEVDPPNVWPAIEARLDIDVRRGEVRQIRFWRGSTAVASALAASLAAVIVMTPAPEPRVPTPAAAPAAFAQLAGPGDTLLAAKLDPERNQIRIRAIALPTSELVPELWIINRDGKPRSLGLIRPDGTTMLVLSPELKALLVDGAVMAVSLEQADGAPHAAPSSTPIATGKISAI